MIYLHRKWLEARKNTSIDEKKERRALKKKKEVLIYIQFKVSTEITNRKVHESRHIDFDVCKTVDANAIFACV